jgi:ATP-dependent RNA helicase DeaD
MMNDMIAAPLAAALSAKGYDALTPVQEAVLAPEVAGRDALVSAQTGSGKTVAFGIAMAPELLAGADRLLFADVPLALVIAPTRELALQVAREFDWLFAETGARIATCVGGMDYRTERRALERGAHIVVGTPGRLRDHIERGSLDLSGLRVAVLDEADEMLDLGFREDLEFILSSAPAERRTLMFSATVPPAIAELAKDFQRDAVRLQTAGEARQHVDIEYRALNVTARDREHAIFNVLRYYEARTAIVFVKTRAAVNHLLARMGNRGFQVVALSGELSQQERTHALQSLRDGRARVCIATDVAARGIDLPGLELVIHADLPSNSETLLHRSGRTGRAGQKGVSALIVQPSDFRKAQRLLQGAKVVAEWAKAPSADDVLARDDVRLMEHPALAQPVAEDETATAEALIARFGAEQVAAAFARLWREGRSAPEELMDTTAGTAPAPAKPRAEFGASVWFAVSVGRAGRAEARWLLPKICDAGGITKDGIGAIRVQENETFVQIATEVAGRFGDGLDLEPGVSLRRLAGEPSLDAAGGPRGPKPRDARPREDRPRTDRPYRDKPHHDRQSEDRPREPREERRAPAPRPVREDRPEGRSPARSAEAPSSNETPARKAWPRKDEGDRPRPAAKDGPKKPYERRDDRAPKPYAKAAPAAEGRKSFGKPDAAGEGRKPYAKPAPVGDRKPYMRKDELVERIARKPDAAPAPRGEDADKKPRWKAKAEGSAESRPRRAPLGDATGPKGKPVPKSAGMKSHGKGKSLGFKSHGKPAARPAADASDTSRRFTPPKKPKG